MAKFEDAIENTLDWEDKTRSGVVTKDKGGRTRFGIAERYNPDMPAGFYESSDREWALAVAKERYKKKYWKPLFDGITNQNVATKIFDMCVNPGPIAIKLLQQALMFCGELVAVDGKFGPATLGAINRCNSQNLLTELRAKHSDYYLQKLQEDPSNEKVIRGWLRRARA